VGKDDWLFTAEELEVSSAERARVSQTASYIVAVGTELFERGARLAVVLLPSKARIYEDKLPGQGLPALVDRRYDTALKLIRDQVTETSAGQPDLEVVDPRPPLRTAQRVGTEVFLRTDTHWSPEGAQIVAEAVARELEPVLARGEIPRTVFRNRPAGSVSHRGDLLRFLPLGPFETALGPPVDVVTRYETFPEEESEVGGLLDDPAIPGALVGTSYSADELWNFRGALSVALQIDFLTVAAEGEGPFAPMMSYLEGETIVDQPPELVIWEIPERYLAHDLPAGWRSRIGD
jgi:alginate O-acetyltransferase complex protein AlgJ